MHTVYNALLVLLAASASSPFGLHRGFGGGIFPGAHAIAISPLSAPRVSLAVERSCTDDDGDDVTFEAEGVLSIEGKYLTLTDNVTVAARCGGAGGTEPKYKAFVTNGAFGIFSDVALEVTGYSSDLVSDGVVKAESGDAIDGLNDDMRWHAVGSGKVSSGGGPVRVSGNASFDLLDIACPIKARI